MDPGSILYNIFSEYGIFTIIAPFLLIFSLTYGLLRKTNLFGKDNPSKEKLYAIISFAISFYYLYKLSNVIFTERFVSFFFFETLALFFLLMVIALLGSIGDPFQPSDQNDRELFERYKKTAHSSIVGFLGLLVLFAFMYASSTSFNSFGNQSMGIISNILMILLDTGLLPIIIIFGILLGVISWASATPKSNKPSLRKRAPLIIAAPGESLQDIIKNISEENRGRHR